MIQIVPAPKKTTFFQRDYAYNGETVRTSIDILLGEEEYILEVTSEDGITIIGGSEKAVFYGECTLEQILLQNKKRIRAMKIEDEPVFRYRGFMIDCARHFFTVDELKAIIDTMARLKFNYFHWHLTDDQGFRMQIDALDKLHKEGSVRLGSHFGGTHSNSKYEGYYTTQQMQEIVQFCAERYIEVVPEIDVPGHATAMIHAYPEMSCRGRKVPVETRQGIFKNILCAGSETTYEYLCKILDEMCRIFPGEYFHLGGDEVPKENWEHCSACKNAMKENGLESYEQLQAWLMNRLAAYLQQKGKKVICWNDALKGENLSKNFIAERWMDRKNLTLYWANSGRKVIMGDFYHTYFDYPYAMTPLKKVYRYSPYLKNMDIRGKESIEGLECCVWTEHISSNAAIEYMLFPRAAAVAQTAWGCGRENYAYFESALKAFKPIFKRNRINCAPQKDWNPLPHKRLGGVVKLLVTTLKGLSYQPKA
ncbi:MAG: beta-N-acetylhexosaminidase [Clostridia bacterium]|nr:beta-N-acetylhexosaminidase [Clostridia bacterium]